MKRLFIEENDDNNKTSQQIGVYNNDALLKRTDWLIDEEDDYPMRRYNQQIDKPSASHIN